MFSSGKDLLPAIDTLVDRRICHIEVARELMPRIRLDGSQIPWYHFLNEQAFGQFRTGSHYALN